MQDLKNLRQLQQGDDIKSLISTLKEEPLKLQQTHGKYTPLALKSAFVVKELAAELHGKIPIIAAGGILSAADAQENLAAGASLVQLYSGLIYREPQLIEDIVKSLCY